MKCAIWGWMSHSLNTDNVKKYIVLYPTATHETSYGAGGLVVVSQELLLSIAPLFSFPFPIMFSAKTLKMVVSPYGCPLVSFLLFLEELVLRAKMHLFPFVTHTGFSVAAAVFAFSFLV